VSPRGGFEAVEVPSALAGERVDRVVAMLLGCSRTHAARLVAAGGLRVGGNQVGTGSRKLKVGERLEIDPGLVAKLGTAIAEPASPGEVPLNIVYDDEAVIVLDKPAGLVVHPDATHRLDTVVAGLLALYPELEAIPAHGCGEPDRPGIVHRLDKDTSGLLVVARTPQAYESLTAQLAERSVKRTYLSLACGALEAHAGVVDAPIGRSLRDPTRMAVSTQGRAARTHYRVLARFDDPMEATYLELRLETGRTHQIRVHLSAIGHPVVGDARYRGDRRNSGCRRPFLHAAGLSFTHPTTGEEVSFASPLPPELTEVLERFS